MSFQKLFSNYRLDNRSEDWQERSTSNPTITMIAIKRWKFEKFEDSLKECLIVFTNNFTAWPLADPMAVQGMNLVVGGNIQRFLVQRSGSVHLRPPTRHCRIEKSCDSPETNVAFSKYKQKKEQKVCGKVVRGRWRKGTISRIRREIRLSIVDGSWRISVYHWVQPRILERSSSGGFPDHPMCPISTLVDLRQVEDLSKISHIFY